MITCYEDLKAFISGRITALREQRNISARDMSIKLGFGEGSITSKIKIICLLWKVCI